MTVVSASPKARLKKLHTLSKEVMFADEDGDFSLYIRKLLPVEERDARQEAIRFKAGVLAIEKEDPLSPARAGFTELLESLGLNNREGLISYVCSEEILMKRISVESQVAEEPRWADNDYLTALQEAWVSELEERWQLDNNDEEAARVFGELTRYAEEVDAIADDEISDILEAKEDWPYDKLLNKATENFLLRHANTLQNEEYQSWLVYYATFSDEKHESRFFESREEVDAYPEVAARIVDEYESIALDALSGKE